MKTPKALGVYCIWNKIKDYGEENFSVTWIETGDDFQKIEQTLIDFVFTLEPELRFNIARKAGGGLLGGTIEGHRELCEVGGAPKAVPLFLICTKTGLITKIESACEGERLGLGIRRHLSNYSKPNCLKTCLVARSEADFNWHGTEVEQGSWFRCTKSGTKIPPVDLLRKIAGLRDFTFNLFDNFLNLRTIFRKYYYHGKRTGGVLNQ